jgi:hypothetical protein
LHCPSFAILESDAYLCLSVMFNLVVVTTTLCQNHYVQATYSALAKWHVDLVIVAFSYDVLGLDGFLWLSALSNLVVVQQHFITLNVSKKLPPSLFKSSA